MTTGVLAPVLTPEFFANSGAFLNGGLLYSFQAGTSTPVAVYTDSALSVPFTNPIVLNSRGEPNSATGSSGIFVTPNVSYKFVLTDSLGNTIWSRDNVVQQQLITLFGGVDTGAPNIYLLNFTSPYRAYSDIPLIYWVPSHSNTGNSTVNVNGLGVVGIYNQDGTQLGANQIIANQITGMIYQTNIGTSGNSGFVLLPTGNFVGSTVGTFGTETAIASASTTDLGTAFAHVVQITGTTTITSFGSSASLLAPIYLIRFTGALTLTYNSSTMLLPGNASIVTTAGDAALVQYLGAGAWKVLFYQYSTGSANTKIKPADTVITTSTTLTADPDLVSNTLGIGRYAFEVYLIFDSVTAADGFKWSNPGSAVDSRGLAPALAYGFVNAAAYGPKSETPYGTTISYATVSNTANSNSVMYKGSLLVSAAGTFGVSWAKVANGVSAATTLRAGSYLTTTLLNTGTSASQLTHSYSSGTGTEVIPSGYSTLTIEVWGGGGGGNTGVFVAGNGAGGGGGGGGGYSRTVLNVSGLAGDTCTYTVGAGGAVAFPGIVSTVVGGTLPMTSMSAAGGTQGTAAANGSTPGSGGAGGTPVTGGTAINQVGNSGGAGSVESVGFGGGGTAGMAISGVYGSAGAGGRGQGGINVATAGANGLIIFTYSV